MKKPWTPANNHAQVDRAEQFVGSFTKAVELMMAEAPMEMQICFSIYARDCSTKSEKQPDGLTCMTSAMRAWLFDRVQFKEYINSFYS